jgi:hypothetical protein
MKKEPTSFSLSRLLRRQFPVCVLLFLLFAGLPGVRGAKPGVTMKTMETWTEVFSDASIKIYVTPVTCDGVDYMRVKVQNLTQQPVKFSYKLWVSETARQVEVNQSTTMEGICSTEYGNFLMDAVPQNSGMNTINAIVTYIQ